MKKKILMILLILGAVFLMVNCGTAKYIPAGSQSMGIYWGKFYGIGSILGGIVRIQLYETPGGAKLFTGSMEQEDTNAIVWIRGKVEGNSLAGIFLAPVTGGTIRAQLSEDGREFKGTFETMDFQDGTWTAKKI
jgi:hypothetical protein